MTRKSLLMVIVIAIALAAGIGFSYQDFFQQDSYPRSNRGWRNSYPNPNNWKNDPGFEDDVFTFVRARYTSSWNKWGRPDWKIDYPDSDWNFSYRVQELTSMKVDPHGKIISLADSELLNYPFVYLIEPGRMSLTRAEIIGLRRFLENGGFLMIDDFWGPTEYRTLVRQLERVLPGRKPQELDISHPIFHIVYDLDQKPQIPSVNEYRGGFWFYPEAEGKQSYQAITDDNDRIMVLICHNTDLGDGWEREGMDRGYFKDYSERWAYPLGINILTYAMTH